MVGHIQLESVYSGGRFLDVEPSHCGYCLVSIRNLNIIRTTELIPRNKKKQISQSCEKLYAHTYVRMCNVLCIRTYMGVSMALDARGGVTYVRMSVCIYVNVCTLRDSIDNVLSYSHLCCYFHSTSQCS